MSTPIPDNRAAFSVAEILEATGGELVSGPRELSLCGVGTDSRKDLQGAVFLALSGERFDAHDFVPKALEQGAGALIVGRPVSAPETVAVIQVSDTLVALGQLSVFHRRRWGGKVVAIGGSAGKTTTKSAISAALEAVCPGQVHTTPGNLNNRVGAPLVMLGLTSSHRVAVVELGTNLRGEIALLGEAVEPDIAVLTLIAFEHAEGIGDIDAIELEEGDLLAALPASGTAIVNGDDDRVRRQLERCPAQSALTYGLDEDADYRLTARLPRGVSGAELSVARRDGSTATVSTPLLGEPGALATLAALAVCDTVGAQQVSDAAFSQALAAGSVGETGRLVPLAGIEDTLVLDDSYNANPASVRSSLQVARELADERDSELVIILGEMRELGPTSAEEHAALAPDLQAVKPTLLLLVGAEAAPLHEAMTGIDHQLASDAESVVELLEMTNVPRGSVILVKGSRGVGLERVVSLLAHDKERSP